ncbi:MAG: TetR family transcriptional regulator [Byssovorax sp.]
MARPRSDIAPRILHAARERFLQEGVDGASLRQIAADAGTSIGMVYYYYPTKDELFLAVVEEIYAGLLAELEEALAHEASAEERIRLFFRRFARMSDEELMVIRLVVREALVSSARLSRLVDRFSKGHMPLLARALLEGVGAGELTDRHHPAVLVISTLALSMVPQVMRRRLEGRLPSGVEVPPAEALASSLVDVLLHGIAPAEKARSHG